MSMPSQAFNDLFFNSVGSEGGRDKIAEAGGKYIRDRLREVSFARKIIPAENISRTECQRSVNHDTLVKIVDIEPNSKAMAITFRGSPTARYIRAARFEIPFFTITSEKFEKTEQELLAYEMPITKIIEENSVKDMQEIEDRQFLLFIEAAVQGMQLDANSNVATAYKVSTVLASSVVASSVVKGEGTLAAGADDFTVYPIQKQDLIKVKQLMHRRRLKAVQIVITEPDFDNFSSWTIQDVGMTIAGETTVEGYKANTVAGLKIIRTIKTDLLREGNVYCFTAPEFLGRFYVLNQTKFYIDKIVNVIQWQSWEDIAIGIGNIASIVKLELFGGSVTPGATTTGYASLLPVEEEDLAAVNNKVDSGLTYPAVDQY